MKMFQLRTLAYEDAIEWILFNRLFDVKEIGKGGFGSVYSATWLDGIRKVEEIKVDDDNYSITSIYQGFDPLRYLIIMNLYSLGYLTIMKVYNLYCTT